MGFSDGVPPVDRSEHEQHSGIAAFWYSLPLLVRWLVSIIIGWFITDVVLNRVLDVAPSPLILAKSAINNSWTPWVLSILLASILVLFYFVTRTAFKQIKQLWISIDDSIDSLKESLELSMVREDIALKIIEHQSSVLSSLDNLLLSDNVPLACKNLTKAMLVDIAYLLDNVIFRCYVLRPADDYLVPYVSQHLPDPVGYERRFYIGPDLSIRRGVAGQAFVENSLQITRVVEGHDQSGDVSFDHEEFVTLDASYPSPQYRSIICVPVRLDADHKYGVLCLDSEDRDAFDSENTQQYLSSLGILMAFVLDLSDKAQERTRTHGQLPDASTTGKVLKEAEKGE